MGLIVGDLEIDVERSYLITTKDKSKTLPSNLHEIKVKFLRELPDKQIEIEVQPFRQYIKNEDWKVLGVVTEES